MTANKCAIMVHWRQTNMSPGARVAPTILEADRMFAENGAFVIVIDADRKTYIPTDLVAMIEVSQLMPVDK